HANGLSCEKAGGTPQNLNVRNGSMPRARAGRRDPEGRTLLCVPRTPSLNGLDATDLEAVFARVARQQDCDPSSTPGTLSNIRSSLQTSSSGRNVRSAVMSTPRQILTASACPKPPSSGADNLFMDVDHIPAGVDFADWSDDRVENAKKRLLNWVQRLMRQIR